MQNPEIQQDVQADRHEPDDPCIYRQCRCEEPEYLFLRGIEVRFDHRVLRVIENLVVILIQPVAVSLYLVLLIVIAHEFFKRFIGILLLQPDEGIPVSLLIGHDGLVTGFNRIA